MFYIGAGILSIVILVYFFKACKNIKRTRETTDRLLYASLVRLSKEEFNEYQKVAVLSKKLNSLYDSEDYIYKKVLEVLNAENDETEDDDINDSGENLPDLE
jgi:DNA replication protein DnaD